MQVFCFYAPRRGYWRVAPEQSLRNGWSLPFARRADRNGASRQSARIGHQNSLPFARRAGVDGASRQS
ncbi:hypothetical protein A2U01_0090299, partial [Trifolium medium]|nr:hypothetical protein [Trifolium medium]